MRQMRGIVKRTGRRILAAVLLTGLVLGGEWTAPAAEAAGTSVKEVVIFHTNDIHGHVDEGVGLARVAAMKKNTENALLLDGGDAIQGGAVATLSNGEDVVKLMNAAGYDAMCTGNHEYDYGQEQLGKIRELAEYPILAANVEKDGTPLLKGTYGTEKKESNGQYTIIERNGIKIGIFGLTTQETRTAANPAGLTGITFVDELETAKNMITALEKEGAGVILCLAHLGETETGVYTAEKLAESLTGDYQGRLDAIIDAHSHTVENKQVNGVQISQTGTALANLGKMTITYDEDTKEASVKEAELLPAEDFAEGGKYADIVPDAGVEQALASIKEKNEEVTKERIADTDTTLWGGTINGVTEGRVTETNLGDLVADSMREAGEDIVRNGNAAEEYKNLPIVTMQNGGGIRATIQKGTVTKGDIVNVLPFGNTISFKAVTPKLLYAIMEQGVSGNSGLTSDGLMAGTTASGGFPQIAGMKMTYDPNREIGSKVTAIWLDGETEPLGREDESRRIIFGSNDFLIAGGNGFSMLSGLPEVAEGGGLDSMFENTVLERTENGTKPLSVPVNGGRIVVESADYTPKDYTACVEIHDMEGKLAAKKEISYYVDDAGTVRRGTTDEEGILRLEGLSDGAHTIGAVYGEHEAYVCSYTGTGIILDFTGTYPQIKVDMDKQQEADSQEAQKPDQQKPDQQKPSDGATASPQPASCTVVFADGGKTSKVTVKAGQKVTPPTAGKKGYVLDGWYAGKVKYDFGKPVTSSLTLTAKWKKVKTGRTSVSKIRRKKKKVTITLKKVSGAAGYQIKAGSNKKLGKNKRQQMGKKNIFTIKKWTKKKIYVKARAYKLDSLGKKVYGKWSRVKKKTKG